MARNPIQFQSGLPLTTWFLAIYLLTQRKNGLSALQLSRELGVSYNTAWKLKHKLLQVMHERNQGETLAGRIEIDDAHTAIAPGSQVVSDGLGCFRAFESPAATTRFVASMCRATWPSSSTASIGAMNSQP